MQHQFIFFGNMSFSTALMREHALARTLAQRGYRVVFIEGMPSIASTMRASLRQLFSKESIDQLPMANEHPACDLTILVPPTVPTFFRSSWTPRLDAWIFRRWFSKGFKHQNWNDTVVMVMFPYWWYGFVDRNFCPARTIIYDICDALEMGSRNATALQRMQSAENNLIADADLITYSAYEMAASIGDRFPDAPKYCLPNAVSESFLAEVQLKAREPKTHIIGYLGYLDPRFADRELLLKVAEQFPRCSVVVRSSMDKSFADRLCKNTNVEIIGFQRYDALPGLVSGFSVGIIPFISNEISAVINPLKLYEYCAAGIPIVAMKTAELSRYGRVVYLAETHEEFLHCIELALNENGDAKKQARLEFARNNTWNCRVDDLLQLIGAGDSAACPIMEGPEDQGRMDRGE